MLCVMMLPLIVVGCASKAILDQCVKPPPPPAWICSLFKLADTTSELDYFTTQGEMIICKNNWKEPSILMSSADGIYPYRWATHAIIVSNTRASSGYKC